MQNNYGMDESPAAFSAVSLLAGNLRRNSTLHRRFSSAYMLVYVRSSAISNILRPLVDDDVPANLREHFLAEMEEEV